MGEIIFLTLYFVESIRLLEICECKTGFLDSNQLAPLNPAPATLKPILTKGSPTGLAPHLYACCKVFPAKGKRPPTVAPSAP